MTQDELIEMAKQAGLIVNSPYLMPHDNVLRGIEAFAKLVAAKEREACAKVCFTLNIYGSQPKREMQIATMEDCAAAIRARGEQQSCDNV